MLVVKMEPLMVVQKVDSRDSLKVVMKVLILAAHLVDEKDNLLVDWKVVK